MTRLPALQLAFLAALLLAVSPGCSKHPVPTQTARSPQTPTPSAPSTSARPTARDAEAMDDGRFWSLVAESQTASSGCDDQAGDLRGRLSRLTAEQVAAFQRIFDQKMDAAYRYDLWAVAYILGEGCSDDCFVYFRAWLIGRGKDYYERAMKDPERSADAALGVRAVAPECEPLLYVAGQAHEQISAGRALPPRYGSPPAEPQGERWREEELSTVYPELWRSRFRCGRE